MNPVRVLERKRDGLPLEPAELRAFLGGYLDGDVPDYQMSAFLMAVVLQGLTEDETDVLVDTMLASGATLDLSALDRPRVDKHSTGGVGDKVSLVLAPLVAELGVYVPMMSGRGLGHTTGTLDKLEAIPGFRVDLELALFMDVLKRVGCAMTGQTREIAPLDRRLYALRDVTGTVPSLPLIAASIMSKKLAEGLDGLVLDVKVGEGAFLADPERARSLARSMVKIGNARGLRTLALLTAMDRPLGRAVGNGLETAEAIRCLRGEGPDDLRELVVQLAVEMVLQGSPGSDRDSVQRSAEERLASGAALERFRRLVDAQGGDPSVLDAPERLHTAPEVREVAANRAGTVHRVRPRVLGEAVVGLGGGRVRVEDAIDPGVGFEVLVRTGEKVHPRTPIGRVHARDDDGLMLGERALRESVVIGDGDAPPSLPLVIERVD
ncbi:MAG: thymidine phosphorylase [Gemmatimonadota bacterium]